MMQIPQTPFVYDSTAWKHALDPIYRHFNQEAALGTWETIGVIGGLLVLALGFWLLWSTQK